MFWICAENSVDNTGVQDFSAPHTTPPASRLGVHKKLGENTAGTADPN